MTENLDPVLGGQQQVRLDPVLGGLSTIKRALLSTDPEIRIKALQDALIFGNDGANLVIERMEKDPVWEVQFAAWSLLRESDDQPGLFHSKKALECI